jgi:ABC-type phosphate transport system substrate-binding protein
MRRVISTMVGLVAASVLLQLLAAQPPRAAAFGAPPEQPLAIVVNRSNPVDNLSFAELRRIFMGERSHWANGRRITLVMIEPGQPERKAMLREVYQMNENDFNTHFLHGTFTGEVFVAPKTLATSVGVRKFVFNVPGAIGYMRAADVDSSVKVLRIDGHLPDDKEYKFRMGDLPGSKP